MFKPLKGGLKLEGKKEATLTPWTSVRPDPPKRVRIPLVQASGIPALPCVSLGEHVLVGQKIAEVRGPRGSHRHASISGTVSRINGFVEILSDGKDETFEGVGKERVEWESLSREELLALLRELGIELLSPEPVEILILNGCESEPYLTSDHSLLMSHPLEILKASGILQRIFESREVIVALEDNKEEVVELLKSKTFFHPWAKVKIEELPTRYPQGEDRILARTLVGREEGVRVESVAKAFAVYEAIVLQKPFYERIVTMAGECVAMPRNCWIRIGTLVEEAVSAVRGFLRTPGKVLLGGPMRGRALESLDAPILGDTSGVLGLPQELTKPEAVEPCIRCNRCVDHCPVSISPVLITLAAEKDLFDWAEEYGARFCIQCGNCSYVCPSKRPMAELLQYANAHLSE